MHKKLLFFKEKLHHLQVLDSKICVLARHVGLSGMAVQRLEKSKHSKIFYWRGKMISNYFFILAINKIIVKKGRSNTVQFLDIDKYFQGSQLWCKDFSIFKSEFYLFFIQPKEIVNLTEFWGHMNVGCLLWWVACLTHSEDALLFIKSIVYMFCLCLYYTCILQVHFAMSVHEIVCITDSVSENEMQYIFWW